ncbi:hypothetical protein QR680_011717 [Steinernema hermaphroditum]|uniref:Uncharacterized protein n=1 Tax=Steinernema hermaphroditum TaxID=289476 RepID=A0AA39I185_9BILA|nr:hypothetical protein QR680_011717 [Steinernema hermaphroditum]
MHARLLLLFLSLATLCVKSEKCRQMEDFPIGSKEHILKQAYRCKNAMEAVLEMTNSSLISHVTDLEAECILNAYAVNSYGEDLEWKLKAISGWAGLTPLTFAFDGAVLYNRYYPVEGSSLRRGTIISERLHFINELTSRPENADFNDLLCAHCRAYGTEVVASKNLIDTLNEGRSILDDRFGTQEERSKQARKVAWLTMIAESLTLKVCVAVTHHDDIDKCSDSVNIAMEPFIAELPNVF